MSPEAPTLTLSRVQSGTGSLDASLVVPPGASGLTLECAIEVESGAEYLVEGTGATALAPKGSRNPVVRLRSHGTDTSVHFDLRQVRHIRRSIIYVVVAQSTKPWDGLLVFETYGGAKAEVPFEALPGTTLVLASLLDVDGEIVLRSEGDMYPDPSGAWHAYGLEAVGLDAQSVHR